MDKWISIIITTKNSSGTLPTLLASISRQEYRNYEVIVIDNSSTDKTTAIAKDFGAKVITCGPERSAQRNMGAIESKYDTFLFLDSDMEISSGLLEECLHKICTNDALCVKERIVSGRNYWARADCHDIG